jgi:hypothetical protein
MNRQRIDQAKAILQSTIDMRRGEENIPADAVVTLDEGTVDNVWPVIAEHVANITRRELATAVDELNAGEDRPVYTEADITQTLNRTA